MLFKKDYFLNFEKLMYVKLKKEKGCILCNIAKQNHTEPDLSVFSDDLFIVTLNLYPYNPGHLLIFPKNHLEDIRHFTKQELMRLNALTNYFLDILDFTHNPFGYNIGYNMGLEAGASIKHIHLHIIPRYPHEIGLADLIAGKRVLVENPKETIKKIKKRINHFPFSISATC
jgi:ATP adenylyltransferase